MSIVDGGWRIDSKFGDCSKTCGEGKKYKMKYCDNPKPQHGGRICSCNTTDENEVKCDGMNASIEMKCIQAPCPGKYIQLTVFTQYSQVHCLTLILFNRMFTSFLQYNDNFKRDTNKINIKAQDNELRQIY